LKSRIVKIVVVVIVAWTIVAGVAARALVVRVPLESADAILVMSGSSTYRERTQKAAELYRERRAPLVLLTDDHTRGGWDSAQQRNPFFVERAEDELIKAGVRADKIRILPGLAASTRDEALIFSDYARNEGFRSVLVVTSSYHSRRALRTMERSFAHNQAVVVGLEPSSPPPSLLWWVRPEGWRTVGSEFVKTIYYWIEYD
jgi:uncharacterized SAM-binding protein YcdF (DUF218 family)